MWLHTYITSQAARFILSASFDALLKNNCAAFNKGATNVIYICISLFYLQAGKII